MASSAASLLRTILPADSGKLRSLLYNAPGISESAGDVPTSYLGSPTNSTAKARDVCPSIWSIMHRPLRLLRGSESRRCYFHSQWARFVSIIGPVCAAALSASEGANK